MVLPLVVASEPPIRRLDKSVEGERTRPYLDRVDGQGHGAKRGVVAVFELAPDPLLQQVKSRIQDLAVGKGNLVCGGYLGVVHGPIEPSFEILALDVRPRDLAEPGPKAVPEINSSGVVPFELDDCFLGTPGSLSKERLLVATVLWQVGHSSLQQAVEGNLDLCNVSRGEWRGACYV